MPSQGARTAMLLGGALVAGLAGSQPARSQEIANATPLGAVSFTDSTNHLGANAPRLDLRLRSADDAHLSEINRFTTRDADIEHNDRRALEFELGAPHDLTGMPLDFAITQRAAFNAGEDGDINRHSQGSEVRIGRAIGDPHSGMTESQSRIYMFAASDNEALTWRPGQDNHFTLDRDTVQVGDRQAGITYQRGPMQASIAYVEREISAQVGTTSHSDTEQFAGFTFTMKH